MKARAITSTSTVIRVVFLMRVALPKIHLCLIYLATGTLSFVRAH